MTRCRPYDRLSPIHPVVVGDCYLLPRAWDTLGPGGGALPSPNIGTPAPLKPSEYSTEMREE